MKRTKILLSMMAVLTLMPSIKVAADDVVKVFSLEESGKLAAMLAEAGDDADSVVVSGRMNADDMSALKAYCANGHVHGVDISEVSFPGDSLPNIAFGYTGKDNPVENITLPKQLRVIGHYAFYNMGNLKHVEIPKTVETIDYFAFACCTSLRQVELPEGLKEMSSAIFSNSGLEELTIPASVKEMSHSICAGCLNLKQLTILADVDEIRIDFASLCMNLESLTLPDHIKKIESRAFSSTSLSTLTWPSALETIDDEAFSGCKFENIVLPSRVTAIEKGAFAYNEQLKTITLPASLLTIEQSALQGCTHVESAVCESPVPPTTMGQEAAPQAILYVPEVAVDAYRAAPWWKDFKEIRAYVPSGIDGIVDKNSGQHPLYSIDGIKVSSTGHRGIMIRDGKKYTSRQ